MQLWAWIGASLPPDGSGYAASQDHLPQSLFHVSGGSPNASVGSAVGQDAWLINLAAGRLVTLSGSDDAVNALVRAIVLSLYQSPAAAQRSVPEKVLIDSADAELADLAVKPTEVV